MQQGPFAPRALPRFTVTTDLAATLSPSTDFRVGNEADEANRQSHPWDGERVTGPVTQVNPQTLLCKLPSDAGYTRTIFRVGAVGKGDGGPDGSRYPPESWHQVSDLTRQPASILSLGFRDILLACLRNYPLLG